MKIAILIKNKREELKETQAEFGKRFNLSHAAISDLENGKTKSIGEEMLTFIFPSKNKFRKKPVIIDAVRWSGLEADLPQILKFIADGHPDFSNLPKTGGMKNAGVGYTPPTGELTIPTLEGDHIARPGDWIIRGVKGEFYPCKPDIFEQTYEKI